MKTSEIVRFAIANHLWDGLDIEQWKDCNHKIDNFACNAIDDAKRTLQRNHKFDFESDYEILLMQCEEIKRYITRMIAGRYTASDWIDYVFEKEGFIKSPSYNSSAVNAAMQAYRKSMLELIAVYFESEGD